MKKMLLAISLLSAVALYAENTDVKDEQAQKNIASAGKNVSGVQAKEDKFWRNADFSEWTMNFAKGNNSTLEIKYNRIPSSWVLNCWSGKLSMETKEDNPQDKYVKLIDARIYQQHNGTQKKYKVTLDAKGSGELKVYVNRYGRKIIAANIVTTAESHGLRTVMTVTPSVEKWQTFEGEIAKDDANEILGFVLQATGEVCVDNMTVIPVEEEGK